MTQTADKVNVNKNVNVNVNVLDKALTHRPKVMHARHPVQLSECL